jgi:hypothetical protein
MLSSMLSPVWEGASRIEGALSEYERVLATDIDIETKISPDAFLALYAAQGGQLGSVDFDFGRSDLLGTYTEHRLVFREVSGIRTCCGIFSDGGRTVVVLSFAVISPESLFPWMDGWMDGTAGIALLAELHAPISSLLQQAWFDVGPANLIVTGHGAGGTVALQVGLWLAGHTSSPAPLEEWEFTVIAFGALLVPLPTSHPLR